MSRPSSPPPRPAVTQPPAEPPPPPPAAAPPARATAPPRDSLEDLFGPDPSAPAAPEPAAAPVSDAAPSETSRPSAPPSIPVVPVDFADKAGFLGVFERDIAAGGLFVTTDAPASLHDIVLVDLRPPIRADVKLCFEARVVHRFDPQSGGAKAGMTGMGVQFLDPDRVRAALEPIVDELRG